MEDDKTSAMIKKINEMEMKEKLSPEEKKVSTGYEELFRKQQAKLIELEKKTKKHKEMQEAQYAAVLALVQIKTGLLMGQKRSEMSLPTSCPATTILLNNFKDPEILKMDAEDFGMRVWWMLGNWDYRADYEVLKNGEDPYFS